MATLPRMHLVRALTLSLGLVGALLIGAVADLPTAVASSHAFAADDPAQPLPPAPAPGALGPVDPGAPPPTPRPHRRHIDNDPAFRH